MKISPFCFFFKCHSHNYVLLHLPTKSLPEVFLFSYLLSPPLPCRCLLSLATCQLPLGLESMPLFVSSLFLPQPLKHYIVIHQLAKSHNKIMVRTGILSALFTIVFLPSTMSSTYYHLGKYLLNKYPLGKHLFNAGFIYVF